MKTETFSTILGNGNLNLLTASILNSEKQWNPHPKFHGVYLKHLITGEHTANRFSSHIVRIDPFCILDEHIHEGITELHEVMEGTGSCILNGAEIYYSPGDCTVIPDDTPHKVTAGKNGLIISAKFIPALL
jgi:quercetin dioxygenase-like cupin family protein